MDSFKDILLAAQANGEWAWRRIYKEFSPDVLRYIKSMGVKEEEDLLENVLLEMVKKIHTFNGDEKQFKSWLFTIAHSKYVDICRKKNIIDYVDSYDNINQPITECEYDEILNILNILSKEQKEIIILRILIGFDIKETAIILSKKENTVKSLQKRALAKMKKKIISDSCNFFNASNGYIDKESGTDV